MKPLFPYYGSKWRDARYYPAPHNGVVIEPFAGSAGYSLFWAPPIVVLRDVDPIIVGVWDYLIRASAAEILALPDLPVGESVDGLVDLPQEARWLIGFWLNRGSAQPKKTRTEFSARIERQQLVWSERARQRIAADVAGIRNWMVKLGSFETAESCEATWFVDPPYQDKGRYYRFNDVDRASVGAWCRGLRGQVIVCEQQGASWLPFKPFAVTKSTKGTSDEVVYMQGLQPAQPQLFGAL